MSQFVFSKDNCYPFAVSKLDMTLNALWDAFPLHILSKILEGSKKISSLGIYLDIINFISLPSTIQVLCFGMMTICNRSQEIFQRRINILAIAIMIPEKNAGSYLIPWKKFQISMIISVCSVMLSLTECTRIYDRDM